MSRAARAGVIAAAAAVVGLVAVIAPPLSAPAPGPVDAASTTSVWGLPPGRSVWTVRLVAESQLGGAVPGQTLTGMAVWRGPVALTAGADRRSVTLTVIGVDEVRFDVAGSTLLSTAGASSLVGREITWVVDERGAIVDTITRGFSGPGLTLLRQLGGELQLPLATTPTWTTTVPTARGRARVTGRRSDDGEVTLTREGYDSVVGLENAAEVLVQGALRATFDPGGHLRGLAGDETIAGLDDTGAVRDVLRATVSLQPLASADVVVAAAADVASSPAQGPSALERAARREALLASLDRQLIAGFQVDGHAGFRALVDALERDDSLVAEVAHRFPRSPGRVTDVLVAAGTPAAQRALVALLADHTHRGDLVQRLGFLRRPEAATLRFVGEVAAGDMPTATTAARLALGTLAGRGQRDARSEVRREAERALTMLREIVDDDETAAADRAVALRGLGNSGNGDPAGQGDDLSTGLAGDDVDRVVAHIDDADRRVRAASASALRHSEGEVARAALLQLVADEAVLVQASALQALAAHLDEGALMALADIASAGGIDRENAGRVLTLVRTRLDEPAARAALEAVIADARTDPFTEGMARDLLDTTAPAP